MAIKTVDKKCLTCDNIMYQVSSGRKFCDECRRLRKNDASNKKYNRNKKPKYTEEYLIRNFDRVVTKPHHLTSVGFDEVSQIKSRSYRLSYDNITWVEVIKKYNKYNELFDYIIDEYLNFYKETKSQNLAKFYRNNKYITRMIIENIGIDKIYNHCGFTKTRYNYEQLKENMDDLKRKFERLPTYTEFVKYSKISFPSYVNHFGKNAYMEVIRHFCNRTEFENLINRNKALKYYVGKQTGGLSAQNTLEDLETEFHKVIEYFKKEHGCFPSMKAFSVYSKYDESTYRNRLNLSWLEVFEYYGYEVDRTSNKAEKFVLNSLSHILQSKYKPQKTFDWLLSVKGNKLQIDGYFDEYKLAIEFDGRQHFEPVEEFGGIESFIERKANDEIKNKLIPEHGITLIRISSDEPYGDKEFLLNKLYNHGILNTTISSTQ